METITGINNLAIGKNAGFDITDQSNQVRIGNFTDEEKKTGVIHDCFVFDEGRVIIKKDVMEYIGRNGGFTVDEVETAILRNTIENLPESK